MPNGIALVKTNLNSKFEFLIFIIRFSARKVNKKALLLNLKFK
jgi:hypothetical protein